MRTSEPITQTMTTSTSRHGFYKVGRTGPGHDIPETMSVTQYSDTAKRVKDDVTKMLEAGWAHSVEKKIRGQQIQEILTMAAVVRYQSKAIEHGGMSDALKKSIKPPSIDPRALASTQPAAEYIKIVFSECKDRILAQHKEIRALRKAMADISRKMKEGVDDKSDEGMSPSTFWDDDAQLGQILGELELDEEDDLY